MVSMTPQDPPTTPPRRVTRSSTDNLVGGVAAGLGRHFGLDPALMRVAFVVLALFGGSGVALYVILWLLLPSETGPAPIGPDASRTRKGLLIALVVAAIVSLPFTGPGFLFAGPALITVAIVGAVGVLIWRSAGGEGSPALTRAAWLVLAVAGAVVLGIAAGVAAAFGAGTAMAVVVVIAGVALVIGGFAGGARWLIIPALVMAVPVAVVSAADIDLKGGVGERDYRPVSVSDLDASYRLGVGQLQLDLSDVDLPSGTTDLDLHVGVGHVELDVPEDVCVQLRGDVGVGEVRAFGRGNSGFDVQVDRRPIGAGDNPVLFVDADVGLGQIEVEHDGLVTDQPACRT
jgi:phage shock protein PspC (stress-responsive transcriptional regulator)